MKNWLHYLVQELLKMMPSLLRRRKKSLPKLRVRLVKRRRLLQTHLKRNLIRIQFSLPQRKTIRYIQKCTSVIGLFLGYAIQRNYLKNI
nr:hypothetical protein Iba_chr07cCG12540 [Ipomoea batatas]